MKIFLDTAEVNEIREANSLGLLDGVTTNPSLIAKSGRPFDEVTHEICKLVEGPVSIETTTPTADELIKEGKKIAKIAKNAVVKIALTGEGLKACKALNADGIKVNVTLCFSPTQALLAAKRVRLISAPLSEGLMTMRHLGWNLFPKSSPFIEIISLEQKFSWRVFVTRFM
jgi:transaldolase